jgi:nucleoside phosphorylase
MPKRTPAPTLILSAMPSEIRLFQMRMTRRRRGRVECIPYLAGRLNGRDVVTAVTGVGVTNGAMVAALCIAAFRPREVIVCGTGSRVNARLRAGDTIISTKTIHHAAGSLTDRGMVYRKVRGPLPGQMTSWYYRPDARLLRLARVAARTYRTEPVTVNGAAYAPAVRPGIVCASDMFGVSDGERGDRAGVRATRRAAHRVSRGQQPDPAESRWRLPQTRADGGGGRSALDDPLRGASRPIAMSCHHGLHHPGPMFVLRTLAGVVQDWHIQEMRCGLESNVRITNISAPRMELESPDILWRGGG